MVRCSEMLVQWTTKDGSYPEAKWGMKSGEYTESAKGKTVTYTKKEMCGLPANSTGWIEPGALHRTKLTDLLPSTRYYYIYGDKVQCSVYLTRCQGV